MNQKMNYFIDRNEIMDLEYNIPLQVSRDENFSMDYQNKNKCIFDQQLKVYKDSSRSLKLDSARTLHFAANRIDLLYWENVTSMEDNL